MRAIFEHVEGMDYLEIILSPFDLEKLLEKDGVAKEFKKNAMTKFNLNVYIRKESEIYPEELVEDATKSRKKQKSNLTKYFGNGSRWVSPKTGDCR